MFSDIFHDLETFLVHKSLPITVHRSSKYFNTLSREHVTCEMMDITSKVRIGVEEMFYEFKHMVCRGSRIEDFGLADVEVEVVIFFENGSQPRFHR